MLDLRQNDGQMENIQLQGRWRTKRARKLRWRRRQREGQDNVKETEILIPGDRCRTGCHDITLQNMQIICVRMNRLNK